MNHMMKVAPEYDDKYANPPTYEEAMKYASMPPIYPALTLHQPTENIPQSATIVPLQTPLQPHQIQRKPTNFDRRKKGLN